ncbi:MAG: ectoine synthase [Caulobacteraceae bacterium]
MILRNLSQTRAGDRNVLSAGWESARMLLKDDAMGFSFHITTMYAGEELKMHYKHHLEAVYVISGHGEIEELATGKTHALEPGVMYALNANDRHVVRPRTDIVTACVFNPPVTGREVHDETGAYPPPQAAGAAAR